MIVGTTPTHTFDIPCNASEVAKVRVIYSQDDVSILLKTETDCTIGDKLLCVTLTQEDTFLFDAEKIIEIQIRILTNNGTVLGSIPIRVGITKCLESEVFE